LAALAQVGIVLLCALDLSTGEFRATGIFRRRRAAAVQEELEQLRPKELLYGSAAPLFDAKASRGQGPQPRRVGRLLY